jgi:hypothetical protein
LNVALRLLSRSAQGADLFAQRLDFAPKLGDVLMLRRPAKPPPANEGQIQMRTVIAVLALAASLAAAQARTAVIKVPCQDMGDGRLLYAGTFLPDWALEKDKEANGRFELMAKTTTLSSVRADDDWDTDDAAIARLDARIAQGKAAPWQAHRRICTVRVAG